MFTKPSRKVHRVFIHCSASDHTHHDNIDTMKSWHLARGFSDVGYHFFIQKDGTLEYGRDIEKTPAKEIAVNLLKSLHKKSPSKRNEKQAQTENTVAYKPINLK